MDNIIIILPILSFILQAAHSMRMGDFSALIIWLILPFFFIRKEAWIRAVLIFALIISGTLWLNTGYQLVLNRVSAGLPWARLSAIMAMVFLLSLLSAILLMGERGKKRFSINTRDAVPQSAIFILTFAILEIMRIKIPITIIIADRFFPGTGKLEIFLLSIYAVWVGGKMLKPGISQKIRSRIWALFSALFFLQLLLGLSGFETFLMTGNLHLPLPALILSGPVYRLSNFFMPILFLSTVFLAGPAWCSHLCYIGAWDDISCRMNKGKIKPLLSWTKKMRLMIFIAAIIIPLLLRYLDIVSGTALIIAAVFAVCGILVMLVFSTKSGVMVHCASYCPIGLAADYLGKISPWRIRINDKCTQCMLCVNVCRYNALGIESLSKGKPGITCTLCGDCISSCKNSHISYHFAGRPFLGTRAAFISTIIIIHTVFLAVARI